MTSRTAQPRPASRHKKTAADTAQSSITLGFDDNRLLMLVFGEHDEHLLLIEDRLGVDITPRGNKVAIRGSEAGHEMARQVLVELYERALEGLDLGRGDVEGAIRMAMSPVAVAKGTSEVAAIRTRRKTVTARSPGQKTYLEAIAANELVFGVGPAGTAHAPVPSGNRQRNWSATTTASTAARISSSSANPLQPNRAAVSPIRRVLRSLTPTSVTRSWEAKWRTWCLPNEPIPTTPTRI